MKSGCCALGKHLGGGDVDGKVHIASDLNGCRVIESGISSADVLDDWTLVSLLRPLSPSFRGSDEKRERDQCFQQHGGNRLLNVNEC